MSYSCPNCGSGEFEIAAIDGLIYFCCLTKDNSGGLTAKQLGEADQQGWQGRQPTVWCGRCDQVVKYP